MTLPSNEQRATAKAITGLMSASTYRSALWSLRVACIASLWGASAFAADPTPNATAPTSSARAAAPVAPPVATGTRPLLESLTPEARADYEAGRMLYGGGDPEGALVKFKAAYDAAKDARLLWDMAVCEKKLRHYGRAMTLVRRYLGEGGANLTAQDRTEAADLMVALAPLISDLVIKVNEPDAKVFVDDQLAGASPLGTAILTEVGSHTIVAKKEGFRDAREVLTVKGGGAPAQIQLVLEPEVHEGRLALVVNGAANATVIIDGKTVGTSGFSGKLRSGGHTLLVRAPNMRSYQSEIVIVDGANRNVEVSLEPESRSGLLPTWVWITGGVLAAGGLGLGGYALLRPKDEVVGAPLGTLQPQQVKVP